MKLVWAGPWNDHSAIAAFGVGVVDELAARGHEVEVLRTEVGAELARPPLPAPGSVAAVHERDIGRLNHDRDGIIVNLGNYSGFHAGAVPLMFHSAPLLILHDATLGGLVNGWRQMLGPDGWRVERFTAGRGSVAPFCGLASGVIVHGEHCRAEAEAACAGPVAVVPLSWTTPELPPPRPIEGRLVVTTVGHVNSNKRADAVIRALGASARLRERVLYILAGPCEDDERERLLALARRVGAPEPHFTGWVPDEMLRMLLAGTDVISCLRFPALEGGSASLILALLSGRPTLVSDHASYAELPDGLVLKCPPGQEAGAVLHHLETILDDPDSARAMADRARAYARARHAPAAYVDRLLPALDAATRAQPAVRTAIAIGRGLLDLGMLPGDPVTERLQSALSGLLAGRQPGLAPGGVRDRDEQELRA